MKRFISFFAIFALTIFALSACRADIDNNGNIAKSTGNSTVTSRASETNESWFADYYRVGWQEKSADDAIIIRSAEELRAYVSKANPDSVTDRLRKEVFDNTVKYGNAFFGCRSLIVVLVSEGSGSVRHKVASVTAKSGVLQVCIDRHNPGMGTDDMASWQIFIEVDAVPAGWESNVVWKNVPLDAAALSPPVTALKNVVLESSQESGMLYVVLQFSGVHSRLYPGAFDTWQMTGDGKELDGNDYGVYGDEYEYYKRIIENGETAFYIPISLYPKTSSGIYIFSGTYQGEAFHTKPLNITG